MKLQAILDEIDTLHETMSQGSLKRSSSMLEVHSRPEVKAKHKANVRTGPLREETKAKIKAKRALQTNIGTYVHTPEIIAKREAKKAATIALRPKKVVPPKVKKPRPPMPEHVKAKLQKAVKSEEYSLMMSLVKTGVKHTKHVADGTRAPMSAEQRELRRQANLGKPKPKTECPHCKKLVANNMLHRYHMDNCKLAP